MAWRMTKRQQVGAIALAFVFLIPPIPSRVASDFVLEPGREARLRPHVSGTVRQIFVKQGDSVAAGQVLAVLSNPEIDANAAALGQQLAIADGEVRQGQSETYSPKLAAALQERERLQQESSVAQQQVEALTIRAPIAGVVVTPDLGQKAGEFLSAGDEFCEIVDRSSMKARILVRDWELEDLHAGSPAQLKVVTYAFRTYGGSVDRFLPAAALDRPVSQPEQLERLGQPLTNYFAVEMVFPNPDGSLIEGMTGTAKIAGRSSPAAWQAGRGAWRWLRSQIW